MVMNVFIFGHICIDDNITENAKYRSAGSPLMFMSKIFNKLPNVECYINLIWKAEA